MGKNTFKEISDRYLDYCRFERVLSKQTMISHEDAVKRLNNLFSYKEITELTLEDILEFKKLLMNRGCSTGYIQRNLCVIRSILKYAQEQGLDVLVPEKVKLPTPKAREVEYLFEDELTKVFLAIDTDQEWGIRFMALVTVLLDTGMRISEALSLNRGDVDFRNKCAYVIGKGGKKRMVMFREWSLVWVIKYLCLRRDKESALFASMENQRNLYEVTRWSADRARKYFRTISKETGVYKFKPHALRRTFATYLWKNKTDIRSIQQLLGHSNMKITEVYLGTDYEYLKGVHAEKVSYSFLETIGLEDRISIIEQYNKLFGGT